mmetsp:Transcript_1037/g.3812  ORF Transcript_1037/g.3812 Transcript_1037/m.3812 type:complete len:250 (-) Transcript_1037:2307-3056(-)
MHDASFAASDETSWSAATRAATSNAARKAPKCGSIARSTGSSPASSAVATRVAPMRTTSPHAWSRRIDVMVCTSGTACSTASALAAVWNTIINACSAAALISGSPRCSAHVTNCGTHALTSACVCADLGRREVAMMTFIIARRSGTSRRRSTALIHAGASLSSSAPHARLSTPLSVGRDDCDEDAALDVFMAKFLISSSEISTMSARPDVAIGASFNRSDAAGDCGSSNALDVCSIFVDMLLSSRSVGD